MLYNGVELPDIEGVWTDKVTYPYATIARRQAGNYALYIYKSLPSYDSISVFLNGGYIQSNAGSSGWTGRFVINTFAQFEITSTDYIVWSSVDILYDDGSVYFAASAPVDPNAPTPITGNMFFETVHPLDDSVSVVCAVSDLSDITPTFDFRYTLSSAGTEVRSGTSDESFTGIDNQYFHLTMPSLTPETEYDLTMSLYADGEDTGISATTTFTTLASSGSGAGEGESTTPDYTNQLGDIQQGIDDVQQSVDNVGTKLDGVQQAVTETKNEITSLPGKIASAISDMIIGLIVPSQEDLVHLKESYEGMLSEKLGFVWQAYDLTTTTVSSIHSNMESGDAYEFTFPGIKYPLNGEEVILVSETSVSLDNDLMDVLRPIFGTAASFICVVAFINMAADMVVAIISGVSMWEFHKRNSYDTASGLDNTTSSSDSYSPW